VSCGGAVHEIHIDLEKYIYGRPGQRSFEVCRISGCNSNPSSRFMKYLHGFSVRNRFYPYHTIEMV
jgi:hypothetical protein